MTFQKSQPLVASGIAMIEVRMIYGQDRKTVSYRAHIIDQNEQEIRVPGDVGNLIPHLTQNQINTISGFMSGLYDKAISEFL